MSVPITFSYAAKSVVGYVRQSNQDSGYAGPNLLVLADGMGGPAGGDIASSSAVDHLRLLDGRDHPVDELIPLLNKAIISTHRELMARSDENPALAGLGTTCIAVLRSQNTLALVHIGDSRAYLFRNGVIYQETTDHSLVQFLVDTGQITPEEAEHHPQRHVVIRILGDSQTDVSTDESIQEAQIGDRWLLCSDGLSGVVSVDTIGNVLGHFQDPEECLEKLVDLALRGGGPDNVTCIIADVVPQESSHQTAPQIVGAAANEHSHSNGDHPAAARAATLEPKRQSENDLRLFDRPGSSPFDHSDDLHDEEELEDLDPTQKSHTKRKKIVAFLLVCLLIACGGYFAYHWSQKQYYVIGQKNDVVIYQGIPQTIGNIPLSHQVEVTPVKLSSLSEDYRQRLREPVVRSSREDAYAYVKQLQGSKHTPAIILSPQSSINRQQSGTNPPQSQQPNIPNHTTGTKQ